MPGLRLRQRVGAATLALALVGALARCGGAVATSSVAASPEAGPDAEPWVSDFGGDPPNVPPPGACRPDGAPLQVVHPERVRERCTSACASASATCTDLAGLDAGYDGSFCVEGATCEALACPACWSCALRLLDGGRPAASCEPITQAQSVVGRPDLVGARCSVAEDCEADELCTDLRSVDPAYAEPRCVRVVASACEVVWCPRFTGCICGSLAAERCGRDGGPDAGPVVVWCQGGE